MKIPVNLNDIQESKPVPAGAKYKLVIASVEETKSQKGAPQLRVSLGIDGHHDAPNVTHFISLPNAGDEPEKAKFKSLFLKRFLVAFGIPNGPDGFDTDDFPGSSATLELGLSEPDDNGNVYNRINLPRLKDEGAKGTGSSIPKPPKN